MSKNEALPPITSSDGYFTYERGHPNELWGWIATPRYDLNADEKKLADNRERIRFLGGVEDEDASYSFDDAAIVELDGTYYLVQAAGCSCPSHEEQWGVEAVGTLSDIRKTITDGNYQGYTYNHGELFRLLEIIDNEKARTVR